MTQSALLTADLCAVLLSVGVTVARFLAVLQTILGLGRWWVFPDVGFFTYIGSFGFCITVQFQTDF